MIDKNLRHRPFRHGCELIVQMVQSDINTRGKDIYAFAEASVEIRCVSIIDTRDGVDVFVANRQENC